MVVTYELYVDAGRWLNGISTIFDHTCCDGLHLGNIQGCIANNNCFDCDCNKLQTWKTKRDKGTKKKDIKELQDKIVGIIPCIVRNGAYLLEMIQNASNQAEHDKFCTMYSEENTQMLTVAREYQAYEKSN